jgi:hypothetical protein
MWRSVSLFVFLGLVGCSVPSLNSPKEPAHACSDMKKACGCPGMRHCCRGEDGRECCTPTSCTCDQITFRDKDCKCTPWPGTEDVAPEQK